MTDGSREPSPPEPRPLSGVGDQAPQATPAGYLTVLAALQPTLAKRWLPDGTIEAQARALRYTRAELEVANIQDLAAELTRLATDPRSAVVRGRWVGDEVAAEVIPELLKEAREDGKPIALRSGEVLRRGELFRDHPCHWVMLDIDGYMSEIDPLADPRGACQAFIAKCLPAAFHGVTFYFALSGSAGAPKHAGKLKVHLWFWLDTPMTSAQLRAWAKTVPQIDAAVFSAVQLHYTAAPQFAPGVHDPVKVRSGLVQLGSDSVHGLHVARDSVMPEIKLPAGERLPMEDPATKPGLVGAFCSVVGPGDLCDLLPGHFEPGRDKRHFSWLGHDTPDGVFITSCGHGLVNMHATAPTGQGRRKNTYDFVREHLFAGLDQGFPDGLPQSSRSSEIAMYKWAEVHVPEAIELLKQRNANNTPVGAGTGAGGAESAAAVELVVQKLRAMKRDEVAAQWVCLAKGLTHSQSTRVVNEVKHLLGETHTRPLRAELQEARDRDRVDADATERSNRVGARSVIQYQADDRVGAAHAIESAIVAGLPVEQYFQFGGQLSRLGTSELPSTFAIDDHAAQAPRIPLIQPLNDVNVLELAEKVAVLQTWRDGRLVLIGIPPQVIKILQDKAQHACPAVAGLVTHPLVLPSGEIAGQAGLHRRSGLYFANAAVAGVRPYTKGEAEAALSRIRGSLLLDFAFATELDRDAAVAALITGIQRRILDIAPGVAIVAPGQSSGKTTLARRIHLVLTAHDMPVMPFPDTNEDEVSKQLLATLLCSPAMVCFDNLVDGTTFRSASISAAMTSPQYKKRILQESRLVTCPTNVLFMLTGNNVSLGADEATRWLTVRLAPPTLRPDQRRFTHPDVVSHALSIRDDVLRDAVGLVAGYLQSGEKVPVRSRFPMWDRYVRQPLMWAGALDVADVFTANIEQGEETRSYQGLVRLLHEEYCGAPFSATGVADCVRGTGRGFEDQEDRAVPSRRELLEELLRNLRAKDPFSASSVGRVLKATCGRPVALRDGTLARLTCRSRDGCSFYEVELV